MWMSFRPNQTKKSINQSRDQPLWSTFWFVGCTPCTPCIIIMWCLSGHTQSMKQSLTIQRHLSTYLWPCSFHPQIMASDCSPPQLLLPLPLDPLVYPPQSDLWFLQPSSTLSSLHVRSTGETASCTNYKKLELSFNRVLPAFFTTVVVFWTYFLCWFALKASPIIWWHNNV